MRKLRPFTILGVALAALLFSGCAEERKVTGQAGDTTPPSQVTDLAATSPTGSTVTVTWTAPGDDGLVGTAASYELRRASAAIVTEADWAAATVVGGLSAPKAAGQAEQVVVRQLVTLTTYYFALRATDESANVSAISNSATGTTTGASTPEEILATSLHNTGSGMAHFYGAAQGGFETMTGIPYNQLSCQNCHAGPSDCTKCHAGPDNALTEEACLVCHGRQAAERKMPDGSMRYSDVHRDDQGKKCWDCHTQEDVHGDGNTYTSMLSQGALLAKCENCHPIANLPSNTYHSMHARNNSSPQLACAACHVQGVVTCYNCHFDSQVASGSQIPMGIFANWKFLLVRGTDTDQAGKIDVGNFQSLIYQDSLAFVSFAPYYSHAVKRDAITGCDDCHNNAYVQEYKSTGKITITTWDPVTGKAVPNIQGKGIIPVPPDWRTAFQFAWGTVETPGNPPTWRQVTPTRVGKQMLFATPLTGVPQ
jgi:hypothetical protein